LQQAFEHVVIACGDDIRKIRKSTGSPLESVLLAIYIQCGDLLDA
jgi:hypothetical protein